MLFEGKPVETEEAIGCYGRRETSELHCTSFRTHHSLGRVGRWLAIFLCICPSILPRILLRVSM
jgi:hypothetical protein